MVLCKGYANSKQFLMHRVELKGPLWYNLLCPLSSVPNAPCGVERRLMFQPGHMKNCVPNAPCGVERMSY